MKRLIAAVTVLVLATSAASALDLSQKFRDGDGGQVPNTLAVSKGSSCGETKDVKCLTLGDAVFHALVSSYTDEQSSISGEEKFKRGKLALAVQGKKNVNLTSEDTVMVKRLIGKLYSPLIVAQAYAMLDPATESGGATPK